MEEEKILARLADIIQKPEVAAMLKKQAEPGQVAAICSGCCLLGGGGAKAQ